MQMSANKARHKVRFIYAKKKNFFKFFFELDPTNAVYMSACLNSAV